MSLYAPNADLKPEGILDRVVLAIWKRIEAMRSRSSPTPDRETVPASAPVSRYDSPSAQWEEMKNDSDRHSVAAFGSSVYVSNGDASGQVKGLVGAATTADNDGLPYKLSLDVKTVPSPRVNAGFAVIEETNKRLGLQRMAEDIIKRFLNEGNAFRHIVVPKDGTEGFGDSVIGFEEVPGAAEGFIMKKLLRKGTLEHIGWGLYNIAFGNCVKTYAPWEIVHYPWDRTGAYGTPLFGPVRLDFARGEKQEDSMVAAREESAYRHRIYRYEGVDPERLKEMAQESELERLKKGVGVSTETFTGAAEIVLDDPNNTQLANLKDVEYFRDRRHTAGVYPASLLAGYGKDINRDILEKQEEGLIRILWQIDAIVSDGYRKLLEIALLLAGFLPEEIPFSFIWTDKAVDSFGDTVEALDKALQVGLSEITALGELNFDYEVELQRHREWREKVQEIDDDLDRPTKELKLLGAVPDHGGNDESDDPAPRTAAARGHLLESYQPARVIRGSQRFRF